MSLLHWSVCCFCFRMLQKRKKKRSAVLPSSLPHAFPPKCHNMCTCIVLLCVLDDCLLQSADAVWYLMLPWKLGKFHHACSNICSMVMVNNVNTDMFLFVCFSKFIVWKMWMLHSYMTRYVDKCSFCKNLTWMFF